MRFYKILLAFIFYTNFTSSGSWIFAKSAGGGVANEFLIF